MAAGLYKEAQSGIIPTAARAVGVSTLNTGSNAGDIARDTVGEMATAGVKSLAGKASAGLAGKMSAGLGSSLGRAAGGGLAYGATNLALNKVLDITPDKPTGNYWGDAANQAGSMVTSGLAGGVGGLAQGGLAAVPAGLVGGTAFGAGNLALNAGKEGVNAWKAKGQEQESKQNLDSTLSRVSPEVRMKQNGNPAPYQSALAAKMENKSKPMVSYPSKPPKPMVSYPGMRKASASLACRSLWLVKAAQDASDFVNTLGAIPDGRLGEASADLKAYTESYPFNSYGIVPGALVKAKLLNGFNPVFNAANPTAIRSGLSKAFGPEGVSSFNKIKSSNPDYIKSVYAKLQGMMGTRVAGK